MNLSSVTSKIKFDRQAAASVIAVLLIAFAGYLVYSYFTKVGADSDSVLTIENLEETIGEIEVGDEELGSLQAPETEAAVALNESGAKEATDSEEGQVSGTSTEAWVATDYKEGDVSGETYTVKSGDTLWEIAEARYGSGFEWTKILEANKDKVGFLPNGTQALIEVGAELTLP